MADSISPLFMISMANFCKKLTEYIMFKEAIPQETDFLALKKQELEGMMSYIKTQRGFEQYKTELLSFVDAVPQTSV